MPPSAANTIWAWTCRLRKLDFWSRSKAAWLSVPGSLNSVLNAPPMAPDTKNVAIRSRIQPTQDVPAAAVHRAREPLQHASSQSIPVRPKRYAPRTGGSGQRFGEVHGRYSRARGLSVAVPQVPPAAILRAGRAGARHHRAPERGARRPGRARLPLLRATRHRQDHDRPAPRQGPELHEPGRRRRSVRRVRELRRHRRGLVARRDRGRRRVAAARSTTCATCSSASPT